MKILLSAYACEPNRGSEPGVGWGWALELNRLGHDVWVLTRASNQPAIEKRLDTGLHLENVHFVFYDLPQWARSWKNGNRGVHLYYLLWQIGAYRKAKSMHKINKFDLVHHVTFVTVRQPSLMGNLGIPFLFGPAAGGERAPWALRKTFGLRGILKDTARDVVNWMIRVDPLMRLTFSQAKRIFVTSEQSRNLVPAKYKFKTEVHLAIAYAGKGSPRSQRLDRMPGPTRLLYIGNFVYWKGLYFVLNAFSKFVEKEPQASISIVGKGPEKSRMEKLAIELNIATNINWIPWLDQQELPQLYNSHDIFLFPSLHDSGGMVVLEALTYGLPVICLDLGGPGEMVNDSCGRVISTVNASVPVVIDALTSAILELAEDPVLRANLANGAVLRAAEFSWSSLSEKIYGQCNSNID